MELFGDTKKPFQSYALAVNWIENEASTAVNSSVDQSLQIPAAKIRAKIHSKIAVLAKLLPHLEIGLHSSTPTIDYMKNNKERGFVFCKTPRLWKLFQETREMEKATRFSQPHLIAHVLTGTRLRLPVVRVRMSEPNWPNSYNLPAGGSLHTYHVSFECLSPRELKKAHLRRFYDQVRRKFQITKKKSLADADRRLLLLIQKYGRPRKNKGAFWKTNAKEWKRRYPKEPKSTEALRKRFARLPKGDSGVGLRTVVKQPKRSAA